MNEGLRRRLREMASLEEKLSFLESERIALTPEMIRLVVSHGYAAGGWPGPSDDVYRIVNGLAVEFGATSVIDPFCGTGELLYYLDDSIRKIGFERNREASKLAQLLNPQADIQARDVVTDPPPEKYPFVATRLIPFSSDYRQVERVVGTLLRLVTSGGVLVFIAPDTLLSGSVYQNLRTTIMQSHSLEAIVELGRLGTHFAQELALVVIKNALQTQSVYLGRLRPHNPEEVLHDYRSHSGQFWVDASQLGIRWDRRFHDPAYLSMEAELNRKEAKPLGELADVIAGVCVASSERESLGQFMVLTPGNLQNGELVSTVRDYYTEGITSPKFERAVLKAGDILVSVLGPKFKTHIYRTGDPVAVANQNLAIVRGAQSAKYVEMFLRSETGHEQFLKQIQRRVRGSVVPRIGIADLKSVLVPLLPLDDLDAAIEPERKVLRERAIVDVLARKLEEKGWRVYREVSVEGPKQVLRVDLALYYDGALEGIVEVKDFRATGGDISALRNQMERYTQVTAAPRVFAFFYGRFYEYRRGELILLTDFPRPLEMRPTGMGQQSPMALPSPPMLRLSGEAMPEQFHSILLDYLLELKADVEFIKETTTKTEEKVTAILSIVEELRDAFDSVKGMAIDVEEKLTLFNQELDKKMANLQAERHEQFDGYVEIAKRWLRFDWDRLHETSKWLLPSAEYLFAELSRFPNTDLSPFIIQYCRALENEMLNKIFRAYLQSLIDRDVDMDNDFGWDFGNREGGSPNDDNTQRLAKYIKRCLSRDHSQWFFELGTMETYLRYLTGRTANRSPLLQDLRTFIFDYFERNVIDLDFLNKIKRITSDYRNKAAHPAIITVEEARNGRQEIRDVIVQFLEYYK